MSTEKMRKLMMLAETMDGVCPHCHGWGEYIDPEGFDEPVHCPHCDEDDEPIRKSRLVKDMAMDMDMDWTDLGLSDVEPEDLKGFPKINEAFTRKHFQMIADTLRQLEDPEARRAQAELYAQTFAADNPRFRRDLFMKAAGVEELDEVQTLPREIKDRDPIKPDWSDVEYETCPECGVEGGHENGCAVLGALYNEDLNEEQSEFRLKDIVGADNFAELVSDMNTGGIDYSAAYFTPLYWHFLDEYPDEIPVGSRTGRPEDPEQYVLDNLERYHSEEIKSYMNTPDMDESNCGVCGETFKWEGNPDEEMCPRCTQEYLGENEGWFDDLGTGEEFARGEDDGDVPSRRVSDEELLAKVKEKLDAALKHLSIGMEADKGDSKVRAIQLRRELKELKAFVESGGDALGLRPKLRLAFTKAEELADLSYEFDDVLWELNDADNLLYLHLSGRPVAIDEASCPCGKEGCECGPDCDCEPVEEGVTDWIMKKAAMYSAKKAHEMVQELGPDDAANMIAFKAGKGKDEAIAALEHYLVIEPDGEYAESVRYLLPAIDKHQPKWDDIDKQAKDVLGIGIHEDISLDNIVESLLDERGMPKDYEMSDDELAAEIEDETSEFERDHIDKEIEDEELGLRFD